MHYKEEFSLISDLYIFVVLQYVQTVKQEPSNLQGPQPYAGSKNNCLCFKGDDFNYLT